MKQYNTPLYHKPCGHNHDCDCDELSSSYSSSVVADSSYVESETSVIKIDQDETFEYEKRMESLTVTFNEMVEVGLGKTNFIEIEEID